MPILCGPWTDFKGDSRILVTGFQISSLLHAHLIKVAAEGMLHRKFLSILRLMTISPQ